MFLNAMLGCLAVLSLLLLLWQWLAARRFPLHHRPESLSFFPPISMLKPLKGCDQTTETALRSWFEQDYPGPLQLLFGVASADDPVCEVVRRLAAQFPTREAELRVCHPLTGANQKIAKLAHLEKTARHELLCVSDADVKVPADFLKNAVAPLANTWVGLVSCFYRLANPTAIAMHWEAVAINADFWSQVLQSRSLEPLDFALGAVMLTRRGLVNDIGGFGALVDCLADDYQLGHRIARRGLKIALATVVVECWSAPMNLAQVWKHQLRWARTIRVCRPVSYFFSILSNPTLWPLLWLGLRPGGLSLAVALLALLLRIFLTRDLARRLEQRAPPWKQMLLPLMKDALQTPIWLLAFLGNRIEWSGERFRLRRDGTLEPI